MKICWQIFYFRSISLSQRIILSRNPRLLWRRRGVGTVVMSAGGPPESPPSSVTINTKGGGAACMQIVHRSFLLALFSLSTNHFVMQNIIVTIPIKSVRSPRKYPAWSYVEWWTHTPSTGRRDGRHALSSKHSSKRRAFRSLHRNVLRNRARY
jgi:hypothetical protein